MVGCKSGCVIMHVYRLHYKGSKEGVKGAKPKDESNVLLQL